MAYVNAIPLEILYQIVDLLVDDGFQGSAVSLARTNTSLHSSVIPEVYRLIVKKKKFFVAHWAAAHGQLSTLRRAVDCGADINEPFPSCIPFISACQIDRAESDEMQTTQYGNVQSCNLHGKELQEAVLRRCDYMYKHSWYSLHEKWYYKKADDYEEIDGAQMKRLFNHYRLSTQPRMSTNRRRKSKSDVNEFAKFADALETKRMFLDAFAYWMTPLQIAIRKGNKDIIEKLLYTYGAKVETSASYYYGGYPSVVGRGKLASIAGDGAVSPIHQALCHRPNKELLRVAAY